MLSYRSCGTSHEGYSNFFFPTSAIIESIKNDPVEGEAPEFLINHADCLDDAAYVRDKIKEMYPNATVSISGLGVVIGAHCGPGLLAVFYFTDARRP